jgi:hypothetical protein
MDGVALGFRVHTGWAALVALGGPVASPRVLERRRLSLTSQNDHDAVFVFHAAAELPAAAAEKSIESARRIAREAADLALGKLLAELKAASLVVVGAAFPASARAELPALPDVLRSHALIHAAESLLYRTALMEASEAQGLTVTLIDAKQLLSCAAKASATRPETLKRRVQELGRGLGAPWTTDQKDATLAALVALVGRKPR